MRKRLRKNKQNTVGVGNLTTQEVRLSKAYEHQTVELLKPKHGRTLDKSSRCIGNFLQDCMLSVENMATTICCHKALLSFWYPKTCEGLRSQDPGLGSNISDERGRGLAGSGSYSPPSSSTSRGRPGGDGAISAGELLGGVKH